MKQPLDYPVRKLDKTCEVCGVEVCTCLIIDDKHHFCGIKCYTDWKKKRDRTFTKPKLS